MQNRIVSSKLKLKINEYNSLQNTYNKLIQEQTVNRKPSPGVKNLLKPNEYLTSNKYLVSDNKAFFLIMQSDGNLVVYKERTFFKLYML